VAAGVRENIAAAATCSAGAASVDQSQLVSQGDLVVDAQQTVVQTLVAGQTGILTGVEVGTDACNGIDPAARMWLTVTSNGTTLGTASISAQSIPAGPCGGDPLSATTIGPGFFDRSSQCIRVTAGQALALQLTVTSATGYAARVGTTFSPGAYPNGMVTANGQSIGTVTATAFKTFVATPVPTPTPALPGPAAAGLAVLFGLAGVRLAGRRRTA
jgi:hypothetical protein